MDTTGLLTDEARLEQNLRATEALVANFHHLAIWHLIGLFLVGALLGCLQLCVEVQGDVAEFLLEIAHDFTLGCCGKGVTTLCKAPLYVSGFALPQLSHLGVL